MIEVKSYQATGKRAAEDAPADQLRAVAHVLQGILAGSGDLLLDRRRELLRRQVYTDGLLAKAEPAPDWVSLLNQVLDGNADAEVNLLLIELALEEPGGATERLFDPPGKTDGEGVAHLPLRRVRLGEQAIQPFLDGLLRRPPQAGEPATSSDEAPAEPAADTSTVQTAPPSRPQQNQDDEGGQPEATTPPDAPPPSAPAGPGTPVVTSDDRDRGFEPNAEERETIRRKAGELYRALQDYGVRTEPVDADLADVGPSIVRYKIRLRPGEQVGKIRRIAEELMRELALEKEPIVGNLPGTTYVHVDLPRPERYLAPLLPILEGVAPEDVSPCTIPSGITPDGHIEWLDITTLPHILVAGATQAGKSMFLYTLIGSLARLNPPDRLHLVLVDPKRTDFGFFRRLPHLHGRSVITDPAEAVAELTRLIDEEMEQRTDRLEEAMYLNIHSYNDDHPDAPTPLIVVVIDEFADLADVMDTREQRETFRPSAFRVSSSTRATYAVWFGISLVM